ncbi:MAG: hypothetical protein LBP28_04240, partial [Coriobacteriales bacterium]|nr:hypothetical protein [Coriobacteriales bacterium]
MQVSQLKTEDAASDTQSLAEENARLTVEVRKLTRQLERERTLAKRSRDNYKAKYNFTEFVAAERARLERHMNLLLQNTRDYMLFFDAEALAIFCTESFYRALARSGREMTAVRGKRFEEIFADILPESLIVEFKEFYQNSLKQGARDNYQVQQAIDFSGTGDEREFLIEITQMHDADGAFAGTMVFLMDTTELVRARREAEAANAAKSDFLANMSHEIRTPMNAIIGLANMLRATQLTEQQQQLLQKIEASSTTLLSLINDILDFSKIEADKLELVDEYYDFPQMLENLKSMFELMMLQKDLRFTCEFSPDLPRVVFGDAKRLRQAATNFLSNAYKYTPAGSVDFTVEPSGEDQVRFIIKDTGIGIKEEDLDKLFSKFSQLELMKNKHVGGTGLGLAISKSLVEEMGGCVSVESVYGEG